MKMAVLRIHESPWIAPGSHQGKKRKLAKEEMKHAECENGSWKCVSISPMIRIVPTESVP
jgi:hypothetical protein